MKNPGETMQKIGEVFEDTTTGKTYLKENPNNVTKIPNESVADFKKLVVNEIEDILGQWTQDVLDDYSILTEFEFSKDEKRKIVEICDDALKRIEKD